MYVLHVCCSDIFYTPDYPINTQTLQVNAPQSTYQFNPPKYLSQSELPYPFLSYLVNVGSYMLNIYCQNGM